MLDALEVFSDAQTLDFAAGSALSTKSIDLWSLSSRATTARGNTPLQDIARGKRPEVVVQIGVAPNKLTSVKVELVQADDAALTSNLQVLDDSGAIVLASLVAGYRFPVTLPVMRVTKRYIGLRFTVVGTTSDSGSTVYGFLADSWTSSDGTVK